MTAFDLNGSLEAAGRQTAEGAVKTWEDLDRYRRMLAAVEPDLIIECGTFSGKSALWFAATAGCDVITIDVHDQTTPAIRAEAGPAVTWLNGNSVDPLVVHVVAALAERFERRVVVLDSDHSAGHVAAELDAYAPLVTPGSYCVVEDTLVRWMPWERQPFGPYDGSPLDAVEAWLAAHNDWEADDALDGLHPTTQFPGGWLRHLR